MGARILGLVICLLPAIAFAANPAGGPPSADEVREAIEKAKQYVYSKQAAGTWEVAPAPKPAGKVLGDWDADQWGGRSALALSGLIDAGESPMDARNREALAFLTNAHLTGATALSVRLRVLASLMYRGKEMRDAARADLPALLALRRADGDGKGLFALTSDDKSYDLGTSSLAVWALAAAAENREEVPAKVWAETDRAWRDLQRQDGSWPAGGGLTDLANTAAGLATLVTAAQYLNNNPADPATDRAVDYIARNWEAIAQDPARNRILFDLSRFCACTGFKYLGKVAWREAGAGRLLASKGKDGAWGDVAETSWGLLFLSSADGPLVINKLQYNLTPAGRPAVEAHWNVCPGDLPQFIRWLSREECGRHLSWQTVSLDGPAADLHQAPILYMAGDQQLSFTPEQRARLKEYVDRGGLIVGCPNAASKAFADSFKKLGKAMYEAYDFRELPGDHPAYTFQLYPRSYWKQPPSMLGLSNGARELMVLFPDADLPRVWQARSYAGHPEPFQAMANIWLYSIERRRWRRDPVAPPPPADFKPKQTIRIARLQHAGNWDPEPGGWQELASTFAARHGIALDVQTVKLADGKLDKSFAIAHLTGTGKLPLDNHQGKAIHDYLAAGGTLLIDAAGGSAEFAADARREVGLMLGPGQFDAVTIPGDPLYAGPAKISEFNYRLPARRMLGNIRTPRIAAIATNSPGKIYFSSEDLSVGLTGSWVDGINGYDPPTAQAIVTNIVFDAMARAARPATAPASAPATRAAGPGAAGALTGGRLDRPATVPPVRPLVALEGRTYFDVEPTSRPAPTTAPIAPLDLRQMKDSIEKGKEYLWAKQNGSHSWETVDKPVRKTGDRWDGGQWGGRTGLAACALLEAGVDRQDIRLRYALENAELTGAYPLALRLCLETRQRANRPQARQAAAADLNALLALRGQGREGEGLFAVTVAETRCDAEATALVALAIAENDPAALPPRFWDSMDFCWRGAQNADGAWPFVGRGDGKADIPATAAGCCVLSITTQQRLVGRGMQPKGNVVDPALVKAVKWIGDNWKDIDKSRSRNQVLFSLAQAGCLTGRRCFGHIDWRKEGTDLLVASQQKGGSWGEVPETSWALMFLSMASAPMAINKLQYNLNPAGKPPIEANWNHYSCDIAQFVNWLSGEMERKLGWQIVTLDGPYLHEAPILYISSDQQLSFNDDERARLKEYVERGGLIVGVATASSKAFSDSFKKLGSVLFPGGVLRELPRDHAVYMCEQYSWRARKAPPEVLGLSNGARELMILIPQADPAPGWQMRARNPADRDLSELMADIWCYSIERKHLQRDALAAPPPDFKPRKTIRIARLQHAGNWDPEPGGWQELACAFAARHGIALDVQTVKLADGKLDKSFALAHLTGTGKLTLDDQQRKAIRDYLAAGGTLLIDAAGGSAEFAADAKREVGLVLGRDQLDAPIVPPGDPLYAAPVKLSDFTYRTYARRVLGNLKTPRIAAIATNSPGKIYFSSEDLSVGLVGCWVDGIIGYDPPTAQAIVTNIIFQAAGGR